MLSSLVLGVLLIALLLGACGGKDSHDKVADETLKQIEKTFQILESTNDLATAERAEGKIAKIIPKLEKLAERYEALPPPDEATRERIRKRARVLREERSPKFKQHFETLEAQGHAAPLEASLKRLEQLLDRMPALAGKEDPGPRPEPSQGPRARGSEAHPSLPSLVPPENTPTPP